MSPANTEHSYPGSLYWNGSTDVDITCSPGVRTDPDNIPTLGLRFVSGSASYGVSGITPVQMHDLGKWIAATARMEMSKQDRKNLKE